MCSFCPSIHLFDCPNIFVLPSNAPYLDKLRGGGEREGKGGRIRREEKGRRRGEGGRRGGLEGRRGLYEEALEKKEVEQRRMYILNLTCVE